MKKFLRILAILCMSLFITSSASATIILNNWTLDVGGIDGLIDSDGYLYTDVDQIGFTGAAHSVTNFGTGAGFTEGIIYATDMIGASNPTDGLGQTQFVYGGNILDGFEMTFEFKVESQVTAATADFFSWTHTGVGDVAGSATDNSGNIRDLASLNIYIDNLNDGSGLQSDRDTGLGFDDGALIATFQVLPGDGGIYNNATSDGSDDATFELLWAETGVFSYLGQDLSEWTSGGSPVTLAITDSNFDGDDNDNGVLDSTYGNNYWTVPANQTPFNYVASEDGSASVGYVPEPTTLLLFGFGLLGMASVSRRKIF